MNPMATFWLVLLVVFLLLEAATVTVTTMWFAAGALTAMISALLGAQVWLQAVLFGAVSLVLLLALRPLVKKYVTPKLSRTNIDSVIGSQGVVLERIDNIACTGRVKLGGMEWSARSTAADPIEAGTVIRVDRIEGVKVFVSLVNVTV